MESLLGFNAKILTTLWRILVTAQLLNAGLLRPLAVNNVTTVTSSESWKLGVDFSIQGSLEANALPPNVGLGIGGPGANIDWNWSDS